MNTYPGVPTADPDGYLVWVLGHLGAALAVRTENLLEKQWIGEASQLAVAFPDPMIRARLAATCSLRQLRLFVTDDHLAVRLACVDNPFAIDSGIQVALCTDRDIEVVRAFLDRIEPCLDAVEALLRHPSTAVRTRLVTPRRKRRVLDLLAADDDRHVRELALDAIAFQDQELTRSSGLSRASRGHEHLDSTDPPT